MKRSYPIASVVVLTLGTVVVLFLSLDTREDSPIPGQPSADELMDLLQEEILNTSAGARESAVETAAEVEADTTSETDGRIAISDKEIVLQHMKALQDTVVAFANRGVYSEEFVRATFNEDDLPVLLIYLMDRRYRGVWPEVVYIVAKLGNPDMTVPVLIDFILREDTYEYHESLAIEAKAQALTWLGDLRHEDARWVLRLAITEEGARDLGKNWLNEVLPDPYRIDTSFLNRVQISAAMGLILTGEADNIALVEARHAELLSEMTPIYAKQEQNILLTKAEKDTKNLFVSLAEMLVVRDLIDEMGREAYEPLLMDAIARMRYMTLDALAKYGARYIPN